ncbi:MAG: hypothetical protein LAO07_20020 [Acidobacteriia bacterium]|nr:hypothetical protein [Terriglobia bacterium]
MLPARRALSSQPVRCSRREIRPQVFFVAYLTGRTLAPGANYLVVFRVAGTAAFIGYGLGQLPNGLWKGQPWGMTIKEVIDGLVSALLTAGTFGWLWPR